MSCNSNYSKFPSSTCSGQGFLPTRDLCVIPQELPYQQRAFVPNLGGVAIPQMGCGGLEGYACQVDKETYIRQKSTKERGSCVTYNLMSNYFDILPCEWQQPDFRPLHFTTSSRELVKDAGRDPQAIQDQQNLCANESKQMSYAVPSQKKCCLKMNYPQMKADCNIRKANYPCNILGSTTKTV